MALFFMEKKISFALFVFFFCVFCMTSSHFFLSDGYYSFLTLDSFIREGDLTLDYPNDYTNMRLFYDNGDVYAQYEPGYAILQAPLYLVGMAFEVLFGITICHQLCALINPLCGAFLGVLIYSFSRKKEFSAGVSVMTSVIMLMGTSLCFYTQSYTRDIVFPCFAFWGYYLLETNEDKGKSILVLAGFVLGMLILVKSMMVLLGGGLLYLFYKKRFSIMEILHVIFPVLFCLTILLVYNQWIFGDWLLGGYGRQQEMGNAFDAFWGLLLSPGYSVFLYNLPLIPALWMLIKHKKNDLTFIFFLFFPSFFYLLFSWQWNGGPFWGPRYLLFAVPFVAYGLALFVKRWKTCKALILLSVFVFFQLPSILLENGNHSRLLSPKYSLSHSAFAPSHSRAYMTWKMLCHYFMDDSHIGISALSDYPTIVKEDGKVIYDYAYNDMNKQFDLDWDGLLFFGWKSSILWKIVYILCVVGISGSFIYLVKEVILCYQ